MANKSGTAARAGAVDRGDCVVIPGVYGAIHRQRATIAVAYGSDYSVYSDDPDSDAYPDETADAEALAQKRIAEGEPIILAWFSKRRIGDVDIPAIPFLFDGFP